MQKCLIVLLGNGCGGVEKAGVELAKYLKRHNFSVTIAFFTDVEKERTTIPNDIIQRKIHLRKSSYNLLYFNKREWRKSKQIIPFFKGLNTYIRYVFWCKIFKKTLFQVVSRGTENLLDEHYDLALDFHGYSSFTTYFVLNMVKANKKATWFHSDDISQDTSLIQYYDRIYCVSYQLKRLLLKKHSGLEPYTKVLYNLIDKNDILNKSSEYKPQFVSDKIVIVSVGRLYLQKGFDLAIRAVLRLINEGYQIQYLIIGNGEEKDRLEALIRENKMNGYIQLIGYQSNPYPFINMCDIYLQPSRREGFALTLAEAKILKKVIVATDFCGAAEQIKNHYNGTLTDSTEHSIYAGLKEVIDNESLRKQYLENVEYNENTMLETFTDFNYFVGIQTNEN